MTAENRRHARYAVEVAAELNLGDSTFAAATQNISAGGVGLVLDAPLEDGAAFDLLLLLTQDGIEDPHEDPFEARAKIAWTAPQEDGTVLAGVRFAQLSDAQKRQLDRFLAAVAENG